MTTPKTVLTLTVVAADDMDDLTALGINGLMTRAHMESTLCECEQAQVLAAALAQLARTNHLINRSPILAAVLAAPYTVMGELELRAAAAQGREAD